ncbi:MAG TPA: hypothetical protein VM532_00690, partial [Burkholderiales bacterium]|nr:hypothetical protein [Burkholderiales bacterium]
ITQAQINLTTNGGLTFLISTCRLDVASKGANFLGMTESDRRIWREKKSGFDEADLPFYSGGYYVTAYQRIGFV